MAKFRRTMSKRCFRQPIPEIYDAAKYLDAAVSAHLRGQAKLAEELFHLSNDPVVREFTESIWGKASPYVVVNKKPQLHTDAKAKNRMPDKAQQAAVRARDGFHCRFCGMPVIRPEVRRHFKSLYPDAVTWGRTNFSQHAAFQCMWLQYDHVIPHSSGGANDVENIVITCAPCNYGKWNYTLEELGLIDPRDFKTMASNWDGLERALV